eukprot:scaffold153929_cov31-Tisochrysis_lutea.AAC.7
MGRPAGCEGSRRDDELEEVGGGVTQRRLARHLVASRASQQDWHLRDTKDGTCKTRAASRADWIGFDPLSVAAPPIGCPPLWSHPVAPIGHFAQALKGACLHTCVLA